MSLWLIDVGETSQRIKDRMPAISPPFVVRKHGSVDPRDTRIPLFYGFCFLFYISYLLSYSFGYIWEANFLNLLSLFTESLDSASTIVWGWELMYMTIVYVLPFSAFFSLFIHLFSSYDWLPISTHLSTSYHLLPFPHNYYHTVSIFCLFYRLIIF